MNGRELKAIRERYGYTQRTMASEMGISRRWYGVLERRERQINYDLDEAAKVIRCGLSQGEHTRLWFVYAHIAGGNQGGQTLRGYERRVSSAAIDVAAEAWFYHWFSMKRPIELPEDVREAFHKGFEVGWAESRAYWAKLDGQA